MRHVWPRLAALLLLSSSVASAQDAGGRFDGGPGRDRGGPGRHPPAERLRSVDEVGARLSMNAEQARLFATLRADAAKLLEDFRPANGGDPFADATRARPDSALVDADRRVFSEDGSRLYAALDERQRSVVSASWGDVFQPLMGPPVRPGAGRRDRGLGRDGRSE